MLVPFCFWLGLAAAAEGLHLGSRSPSRHADPPATEEAAFFDNGRWVEVDGKYKWKLEQGSMDDFDAGQFCKDLPGDVLLVGDSLTHQHYLSLLQQACPEIDPFDRGQFPCWYTDAKTPQEKQYINERMCCNGTRRIAMLGNNVLMTRAGVVSDAPWAPSKTWQPAHCREHNHEEPAMAKEMEETRNKSNHQIRFEEQALRPLHENFWGVSWDWPEVLSRFKVFILNTGAHYQEDPVFRELVQNVSDVFESHPEVDKRYVFWRTTMPGVSNCTAMNGKPPFQSLKKAEKYYAEHPWYESAHFKRQNEIAKSVMASHGYSIIDVYKASMMNGHSGHRADNDCLHYDDSDLYVYQHWNRILYNLMRRRAGNLP
jgi:hypothetical protein